MIRSKRYPSLPSLLNRKQTNKQIFSYTASPATNDIQFVTMDALAAINETHPLVYFNQSVDSFPVFDGPFQVIEPGSDLYMQLNSSMCFDSYEPGLEEPQQQDMYFSENGIPQQVVDDVFRMEDELQAGEGLALCQYPVAGNQSMTEFEQQLVAEMEKFFPQVKNVSTGTRPGSRLMEELTKISSTEDPCYMSVLLKDSLQHDGRGVPKLDILKRDKERGFRCVDMIDGNGSKFKAKYYEHITIQKHPKLQSSVPNPRSIRSPIPYRPISELLQSTQLVNVSPSVANKIERLANSNQNVTLTQVLSTNPSTTFRTSSSNNRAISSVVIKAPKRTIASSAETDSLPLPKHFPMPIIKQEPLDDFPVEAPLRHRFSQIDSTRIEVPTISLVSKQPRKQKLQSLAQCDVIFKETSLSTSASFCQEAPRKVQQSRARSPNDFVTVTIKDSDGKVKKEPQQLRPIRRAIPRSAVIDSSVSKCPSADRYPTVNKRVTQYRVQTVPKNKRVIGQPVESIEILDSSEEESDSAALSIQLESGSKDVSKCKLPGNTESIQCPFCCKIFMSPLSLTLHRQNCADASMFMKTNKNHGSSRDTRKERTRNSIPIEGRNYETHTASATKTSSQNSQNDQPSLGAKKKRSSASHKKSERLAIEILSSAFNIDNLLVCKICKKTFRSQDHLDMHRKIHDTQFVCQFCKKKFRETPVKHTCQEMKRSVKDKRKTSHI
ncbi:uncharacterized protein LOC129729601 [Wyeomyia smithii]|uniref:uncharacterized protein LOC129729601 n=1 Tax=Wyeomyia smithii TaxID=174621 RepID=UPI00246801C3|nr:uncharacterized protein LOC129729601 [Wyeomyia smithii]